MFELREGYFALKVKYNRGNPLDLFPYDFRLKDYFNNQ